MKKIFLFLICLVLFMISVAGASAADLNQTLGEDTFHISQRDGETTGAYLGTYEDLVEEIGSGGNITLSRDSYAYDGHGDIISITSSGVIDGRGAVIDICDNYMDIFSVSASGVTIKNIVFKNAEGCMIHFSGSGTVENCNFDNAGFLSFNCDNANVINCVFNNTVMEAALYSKADNTIISDCTFTNNGVFSEWSISAGAVYVTGNNTIISNCYFEGNSASSSLGNAIGGAVYGDGNLSILNSTFISNTADSWHDSSSFGGAVYCDGNLSISDSTFSFNDATIGGGVYCDGNLRVSNSTFSFNDAVKGGGLCCGNIVDIKDSIFTSNSAEDGDAIWAYEEYSSIENCTFIENDYHLVRFYIYAPDLIKDYHSSERFYIYLSETGMPVSNANVTITINGRNYIRTTDENGSASIAINLNPGKYSVVVTYGNLNVNSSVTVQSTIYADDLTKIFGSDYQYYAQFYDIEGVALPENTAVEFNINGVLYTRYTNEVGVARMNINLAPGTYIITAKNPASGEMYSNTIKVLPSIVENSNLIKYFRNDSQYVIRLLDGEGNPVGENIGVTFNINGVFYMRMSNASGHVKMNINLDPGEYIITADYNGMKVSNKITVLPTLKAEDLRMSYRDGSTFNVTVLDGMGSPLVGVDATFNINGVFYNRTTDENGIARLNINLMSGEYIITSSYSGCNIANKITISS